MLREADRERKGLTGSRYTMPGRKPHRHWVTREGDVKGLLIREPDGSWSASQKGGSVSYFAHRLPALVHIVGVDLNPVQQALIGLVRL